MNIGDQKVQRTLRKQKVRGLLQDNKVPGTKVRARTAAAPGPPLLGLPQDSWERAGLTAPSPVKKGPSNTVRDLVACSCREGNKTKWKTQGDCRHWRRRVKVGPPAIMTQTAPGLAGDMGCVREQALPCTEGARGSNRRIFPKKKKTLWGTLGNSPAATAPVSSPPGHPPVQGVSAPHLGGN